MKLFDNNKLALTLNENESGNSQEFRGSLTDILHSLSNGGYMYEGSLLVDDVTLCSVTTGEINSALIEYLYVQEINDTALKCITGKERSDLQGMSDNEMQRLSTLVAEAVLDREYYFCIASAEELRDEAISYGININTGSEIDACYNNASDETYIDVLRIDDNEYLILGTNTL